MTAKYNSETIEKIKSIFSEYIETNTKIRSKSSFDEKTNKLKVDIVQEIEWLSLCDLEQKIIEELSK